MAILEHSFFGLRRQATPLSPTMLKVQRGVLSRPRKALYLALAIVGLYWVLMTSRAMYHDVPLAQELGWHRPAGSDEGETTPASLPEAEEGKGADEDNKDVEQPEESEKEEDVEARIRKEYEKEYQEAGKMLGAGAIYGNTISNLVGKDDRKGREGVLAEWNKTTSFSSDRPFVFNPYPKYNSREWRDLHQAEYVPCIGPTGQEVEDISAFLGHPRGFPSPGFGSYDVLGIDQNLCFESQTRLGPYSVLQPIEWDKVDWGELQRKCVARNKARFYSRGPLNDLVTSAYGPLEAADGTQPGSHRRFRASVVRPNTDLGDDQNATAVTNSTLRHEPRTAVLLRSYTGKQYTTDDKETIRAMIAELSLRSGGEYQVFLLVQVKENDLDLWDEKTHEHLLDIAVPREFRNMTLLWNDDFVQALYPKMERGWETTVHTAQFLSVQKFMQDFREFDYVWNWEIDSRLTGHFYDMLTKLSSFAKKQPRKGLWERNERFYIPSYYGDYDTDFRKQVEELAGEESVWGPPDLGFINPVGPKPPVSSPDQDNYVWGVGEDADLITLSPIFNPVASGWVLGHEVWLYNDSTHTHTDLPRRTTIVTQCRISRRLLDIMHVENLRGNHVASEMTTGTVALLHGLKAVYAPQPVFFDRPWEGASLAKWFNGGPRGESGGEGSAMGWGREVRFRGATWYYRAEPPQRLYNNWIGYEDHGVGGEEWEKAHGRPCLPTMFLHPIKDIKPTELGYSSESRLPYD